MSLPSAVLGLGVFVVALWAQPDAAVGAFYDDGLYVTLAKALAEGHGFRNIHLPGAPPGVHYPFLYPAVLALPWRLWPSFPANVVLFQLVDCALLGLAASRIAETASRWPLPPAGRYAALVVGFTAFPLLTMVGVRFSEPLFLLLLVTATSLADREPTDRRAAAAGLLAGLALLARTLGIAVVAGIPLALWLRGRRRQAVIALAVAGVVVVPWLVWTARHAHQLDPRIAANYGTYLAEAGQAGLGAFAAGLDFRALAPLARLTIPILPLWPWRLLALLLIAVIVWGAVRVWRTSPALVLSLAGYTGLVSLWPYLPDRFMWILLPLVACFALMGMRAAWDRGWWGRGGVTVLALVLTLGYARRELNSLWHRYFADTAEAAGRPIQILSAAIAGGTPPDAIVAAESEAAVFLYSGRRAVPNVVFRWSGRETTDLPPEQTVGYFCDTGVTHIALIAPEGGAADVVALLRARGDSSAVPLFLATSGLALYRFRCPA